MSTTTGVFPPTRWSLLQRVREGSADEAFAALEALCRAYWHPLYCVGRRRGLDEQDAQDAVQGFFQSILRRETFATADESIGKLRFLLLRAFENFCGQQRKRSKTLKRGGAVEHIELTEFIDTRKAEEHYLEADTGISIDVLYTREWATAVLERSIEALREDYARRGWEDRFELLAAPLLQKPDETRLTDLAARAGVTPGALRITLHRMRGHFRDMIERELAMTVGTENPQVIRKELTELFKAFA